MAQTVSLTVNEAQPLTVPCGLEIPSGHLPLWAINNSFYVLTTIPVSFPSIFIQDNYTQLTFPRLSRDFNNTAFQCVIIVEGVVQRGTRLMLNVLGNNTTYVRQTLSQCACNTSPSQSTIKITLASKC